MALSESEMYGESPLLECTLRINENDTKCVALYDSGAEAYALIDRAYVRDHAIPTFELKKAKDIRAFDGRLIHKAIHSFVHAKSIRVGHDKSPNSHTEKDARLLVVNLAQYPVLLGSKWFLIHGVTHLGEDQEFLFKSKYCQSHCQVPSPQVPVQVFIKSTVPKSYFDERERKKLKKSKIVHPETKLKSALRTQGTQATGNRVSWWDNPIENTRKPSRVIDIAQIGAVPFARLSTKPGIDIFAATIKDIEKALAPKKEVDPKPLLPKEYHEFLDVFSRTAADVLPPHRPCDHHIEVEGSLPKSHALYAMSQDELRVLRKYLDEHLQKGFIRPSQSPIASPVLFAKKPGGGLRFCVDYRGLNAVTIKNRYPLPLIRETLNRLSRAKYFTKLDIIAAFNKIRIAEGQEWMTAFRTRFGLFEYLVAPFGLCNAPATFQHYINDVLFEFLDQFCTAYIDDILIYSDTLEEHKIHVRSVLSKLREAGLQVDITKCEFHVQEVKYLGLIVSTKGISMDPDKVQAVTEWPTPRNIKDVQAFLGFANFYRRFIQGFSRKVRVLTNLTKKEVQFDWTPRCQEAFELLKKAFVSAPILALFDPELECIVETDASDFVTAGILSQKGKDGLLRPVAYFSRKHSPAECNYEIYDKELLAIIRAFEEWRPELEGSGMPVQVLTDHRNLEYFMTTKSLTRRQARWAEFLSRFDFRIQYRPGTQGGKPDALTRRSGDLPNKEGDERIKHQDQVMLRPENLAPGVSPSPKSTTKFTIVNSSTKPTSIATNTSENQVTIQELLREAYGNPDQVTHRVMFTVTKNHRNLSPQDRNLKISLSDLQLTNNRLYYRSKLWIPDHDALRLKLLRESHDLPAVGHPGPARQFELLSRHYFWPGMKQDTQRYHRNCHVCSRAKVNRDRRALLKPLSVPEQRWSDISMDFVTGFPTCTRKGTNYDAVLVVVDRLTKQSHFIPCSEADKETTAVEVAKLYVHHVWKLHGLPKSIVSDRGRQFCALFWRYLCQRLGIQAKLSTAYHPETDGQTENTNALMERYLRSYVTYLQDDWVDWLPLAEFAKNNTYSETIKTSPFFANYGFHPRLGLEPGSESSIQGDQRTRAQLVAAESFASKMDDILGYLRQEMTTSQSSQEHQANAHRRAASAFKVGDLIWLDSRHIRTERPCRKLDWKNQGPFMIKEVVSPYAYRLDLPPSMEVHDVFYSGLLRLASEDPFPGQSNPPAPPIITDGEEEWEVEEILDSKRSRHDLKYYVKWIGYDVPSWEPSRNLTHCQQRVQGFHDRYPRKPGPSQE